MSSNRRPIYGFGINDADYPVAFRPNPLERNKNVMCIYYKRWHGMLWRVHKSDYSKATAAYSETTVSEDMKYFMEFRDWAEGLGFNQTNYMHLDLDKDILFEGNNCYSKDKCAFVTQPINKLLSTSEGRRGEMPIGVSSKGSYYAANYQYHGKRTYLGKFATETLAHQAWQLAKAGYIEHSVSDYEQVSENLGIIYRDDIVSALLRRSDKLRNHAESGVITTNL